MILGQCNRCGKCCEEAYRFRRFLTKEDGIQKLRAEIKPIDPALFPCQHLIYDIETHIAICTVQEEKKVDRNTKNHLDFCRDFPLFKEEILYPTCGYYFKED